MTQYSQPWPFSQSSTKNPNESSIATTTLRPLTPTHQNPPPYNSPRHYSPADAPTPNAGSLTLLLLLPSTSPSLGWWVYYIPEDYEEKEIFMEWFWFSLYSETDDGWILGVAEEKSAQMVFSTHFQKKNKKNWKKKKKKKRLNWVN